MLFIATAYYGDVLILYRSRLSVEASAQGPLDISLSRDVVKVQDVLTETLEPRRDIIP